MDPMGSLESRLRSATGNRHGAKAIQERSHSLRRHSANQRRQQLLSRGHPLGRGGYDGWYDLVAVRVPEQTLEALQSNATQETAAWANTRSVSSRDVIRSFHRCVASVGACSPGHELPTSEGCRHWDASVAAHLAMHSERGERQSARARHECLQATSLALQLSASAMLTPVQHAALVHGCSVASAEMLMDIVDVSPAKPSSLNPPQALSGQPSTRAHVKIAH
jgi:hypothetical protein